MGHINDIGAAIREAIAAEEGALIGVRRDLHAHPELAFNEVRTAGVVAREIMGAIGASRRRRVAGLG